MNKLPEVPGGGRGLILARLVLWGLGQAAVSVAAALLVRQAISGRIVDGWGTPFELAAAFGVLALILAGLRVAERVDSDTLGQRYVAETRARLYRHVLSLPLRTSQSFRQGQLMLRFLGDLGAVRQWISRGIARITVSGVAMTAAIGALWILSPPIAIAVTAIVLFVAAVVVALGPALRSAVRDVRRQRSRMAGNVGEKLRAATTVQAHGDIDREIQRLNRQSDRFVAAIRRRAVVASLIRALPESAILLAMAGALSISGWSTGSADIDAGALLGALVLLGILSAPLMDLARVYEFRQSFEIAREKILQVFALAPVADGPGQQTDPQSVNSPERETAIVFDDVTVDGVFDGLSGSVTPGQTVAVMGANGAGKSTLLNLAAGLTRPDTGTVWIDNRPVLSLSRKDRHRLLSVVSRDVPLLRGTIESNIRTRWRRAPERAIDRACRRTGLDRAIEVLPDGMATRVAEGGSALPAGIRQRVALTRAIVDNPRILLLDEPEVELDAIGRRRLKRLLRESKRTILLVTHDRGLARRADVIWRIEDGRLVEQPTNTEKHTLAC